MPFRFARAIIRHFAFLFYNNLKKNIATIDHAIKIVVGKSSSWHQQIQEFRT
jgi:hypothetical protein